MSFKGLAKGLAKQALIKTVDGIEKVSGSIGSEIINSTETKTTTAEQPTAEKTVNIKSLKCPACGADLDPTGRIDVMYCEYCGTKILLDGQDADTLKAKVDVEKVNAKKHLISEINETVRRKHVIDAEQAEKERKDSWKTLLPALGLLLICLVFVFSSTGKSEKKSQQQVSVLEQTVVEIQQDIDAGRYDEALIKANGLYYTANYSSDEEKRWNNQRESLIKLIEEKKSEQADGTIPAVDSSKENATETEATQISEVKDTSKDESQAQEAVPDVLTADNCEELAALLKAEYVDPDKAKSFVENYKWKKINFDCLVYYIEGISGYTTRYKYTLVPGTGMNDIGATFFVLENVGFYDFHLAKENKPSSLPIGSKLNLTAEVESFDGINIIIDPVESKFNGLVEDFTASSNNSSSKSTNKSKENTKDDSATTKAYIAAIDKGLKDAYKERYTGYEYIADSQRYQFYFVIDDFAEAYILAPKSKEIYNNIKGTEKSLMDLSEYLYNDFRSNLSGKPHVATMLLNDIDNSKVLFTSLDGGNTYSALD